MVELLEIVKSDLDQEISDGGKSMNAPRQPDAKTRLFARVLGPYLVIATASALGRASQMKTLLRDFDSNSAWPWVTGAFVLLCGLVVVALHQNWRGAPAIIVTLLGWLTALKGLVLLALPEPYLGVGESAVDSNWWRVVMVITALAGVYLTYVGWAPARNAPTADAVKPSADLPRAA